MALTLKLRRRVKTAEESENGVDAAAAATTIFLVSPSHDDSVGFAALISFSFVCVAYELI